MLVADSVSPEVFWSAVITGALAFAGWLTDKLFPQLFPAIRQWFADKRKARSDDRREDTLDHGERLRQEIENRTANLKIDQETVRFLKAQFKQIIDQTNQTYQGTINQYARRVEDLEAGRKEDRRERDRMHEDIIELRTANAELSEEVEKLKESNGELSRSNAKLLSSNAELIQSDAKCRETVEALKRDVGQLRQDVRDSSHPGGASS